MTPQETPTSSETVKTSEKKSSRTPGILGWVERLGNLLPNPFWLFVCLAGIVLVASWLGS